MQYVSDFKQANSPHQLWHIANCIKGFTITTVVLHIYFPRNQLDYVREIQT